MKGASVEHVLPGTWRIVATTFPMWLSEKRSNPTFEYTLLSKTAANLTFSDDVSYHSTSGTRRHIRGVDTYNARTGAFTWRGNGLLKPLKSTWRIRAVGEGYAIIQFSRSLFTPSGVDIITQSEMDIVIETLKNEPSIRSVFDEYNDLQWLDDARVELS